MVGLDAYDEILTVLGSQYAEVNGCDFYRYLFPENEERGNMYTDFSHPNAIYPYQTGGMKDGPAVAAADYVGRYLGK